MPPLLADFTHARPCKPFCEKYLTLPSDLIALVGVGLVEQEIDVAILVNWDNPLPPDYSPYLVPLKTYMGEDIASYEENMMVHPLAGEALATMLTQANNDGVRGFIINSVYRPIDMQQQLWSARLEKDPQYGSEPKSFPVKVLPGNMSEHPTGLAIDILSQNYDVADSGFANTDMGRWLAANAHCFGFVLRYPKDKENITGVIFEPWHFRYVGLDIAEYCYNNELCLEEYYERVAAYGIP